MKKILSIVALTATILLTSNNANAQNISFSINIGSQPAWGPTGYDYVDYYYFPDFNGYYDINNGMFVYFDRGRWITARYLPAIYRHFDLYNIYKVALNVHKPWLYNNRHVSYYSRYKNYRGHQVVIRDSRDKRYHTSRNNHRPWSPERNDRYSRPNNRPNHNSGRPNINNNSPSNRPNNNFDRPANNNNNNNRPSYGRENNRNNNRSNNRDSRLNTRQHSSSRPSYNSDNNRNKNNSRSANQSSKNRSSKSDSGRSTYRQTRF